MPGNKFQAFTTLFENTFARTFNLDRFLKRFRPLLRVDLEEFINWYTVNLEEKQIIPIPTGLKS